MHPAQTAIKKIMIPLVRNTCTITEIVKIVVTPLTYNRGQQ